MSIFCELCKCKIELSEKIRIVICAGVPHESCVACQDRLYSGMKNLWAELTGLNAEGMQ